MKTGNKSSSNTITGGPKKMPVTPHVPAGAPAKTHQGMKQGDGRGVMRDGAMCK